MIVLTWTKMLGLPILQFSFINLVFKNVKHIFLYMCTTKGGFGKGKLNGVYKCNVQPQLQKASNIPELIAALGCSND